MELKNGTIFYRRYVAFMVISPNVNAETTDKIMGSFTGMLEKLNGIFEKYENLGVKNLAYKIAKNSTAILLQIYFKLPDVKELGKNVEELKRIFSNVRNANILRSMILSINHNELHFSSLRTFQGFEISATSSK